MLTDLGNRIRWRDPATGLFRWGRVVDATEKHIDVDVVDAGLEPVRIPKRLVLGHAYGWGPMRRYQTPPDNVPSLVPFEAVIDGKEDLMSTPQVDALPGTSPLGVTPAAAAPPAKDAAASASASPKKGGSKKAKRKSTPKAKSNPKAPKASKGSKGGGRKPDGPTPDRTFAVRITTAELEAIHKAAGPRGATRFAREVLAAFANADVDAFKATLKAAAENRAA